MEDEALIIIIDRLKALVEGYRLDIETVHIDADTELRRAVEVLGEMSGQSTLAGVIVEWYSRVPKWYS